MKLTVRSEDETVAAARKLATELKGREIITLTGPLGVGKTSFARALIRALCGNETMEVPSPTFTLLQTYEGKEFPISHFDLYRLKDPDEIYELGWEESLNNGVTLIEWPERLGERLPRAYIDISLSAVKGSPDSREIEIKKAGA